MNYYMPSALLWDWPGKSKTWLCDLGGRLPGVCRPALLLSQSSQPPSGCSPARHLRAWKLGNQSPGGIIQEPLRQHGNPKPSSLWRETALPEGQPPDCTVSHLEFALESSAQGWTRQMHRRWRTPLLRGAASGPHPSCSIFCPPSNKQKAHIQIYLGKGSRKQCGVQHLQHHLGTSGLPSLPGPGMRRKRGDHRTVLGGRNISLELHALWKQLSVIVLQNIWRIQATN